MKLNRRSFLGMAAVAASSGAAAFVSIRSPDPLAPVELTDLFSRYKAQAARVGERYLECAEGSGAQRPITIADEPLPSSWNRDRLRAYVESRIESDFELGRTVDVDGWILSETEADLCALVAECATC